VENIENKGTDDDESLDDDEFYEVEAILGRKYNKRKRNYKYLVKWKNYSEDDNTWEPEENLSRVALDAAKKFDIETEVKGSDSGKSNTKSS